MSFQKQIERQLAQEFSPGEATILLDSNDAVFLGRRLQAQAMSRLLAQAWRALAAGVKNLSKPNRRGSMAALNDHLRQDIGLKPTGINMSTGRGYT